jgi:hypothetical protein
LDIERGVENMPTKEYGEKTFEIRGLKRGEIKALRKKGFSLAKIDPAEADILADEIVGMILGDAVAAADELPNREYVRIFTDIMMLTYGSEESEKNSQTSGGGETAAE